MKKVQIFGEDFDRYFKKLKANKMNLKQIKIRNLENEDCTVISNAFKEQGWEKKTIQYKKYLEYQKNGQRDILVTELNNDFVGYLTINWKSDYIPFQQMGIPEIVDFNVLKKYQRLGIGTIIMNEAEARIKKVSKVAGIGVGLMKDYGAAQILYVKRGYIPDGAGIIKSSKSLSYGDKVTIDDDIAIYLTKYLG